MAGPRPIVRRWRFGEPVGPLREILDRGGVLAVPTESSYGLAADPWNGEGIRAIYRLKGRAADKPLPVVAADLDQVAELGLDLRAAGTGRLGRLWPGAVTVVLPFAPGVRALPAAAGGDSVAVRVPGHAALRRLLAELGRPLTATSANPSGEAPVLEPEAAAELLTRLGAGEDAAVVDGGRLAGGAPSTIVRLGPVGLAGGSGEAGGHVEILRRGAVPAAEIRRRLAGVP